MPGVGPVNPATGQFTSKPMPKYFSGSNCRAFGEVWVAPRQDPQLFPPSLVRARLSINGQVVKEETWSPPPQPYMPPRLSATLRVMFDSSAFPAGSSATILIEGWDQYNRKYSGSGSGPVVNGLFVARQNEDRINTWNAPPITTWMLNALTNYEYYSMPGDWRKPDYFPIHESANVIVYAGHGTPTFHQDGFPSGGNVLPADYLANRTSRFSGLSLPPFNATGGVPTNFLHVLHCNSGSPGPDPQGNQYSPSLVPYQNAYTPPYSCENQSTLTYAIFLWVGSYNNLGGSVAVYMNNGLTALEARNQVLGNNNLHLIYGSTTGIDFDWGSMIELEPEHSRLWGDFYTRTKGAYTGTTVNLGWSYGI